MAVRTLGRRVLRRLRLSRRSGTPTQMGPCFAGVGGSACKHQTRLLRRRRKGQRMVQIRMPSTPDMRANQGSRCPGHHPARVVTSRT